MGVMGLIIARPKGSDELLSGTIHAGELALRFFRERREVIEGLFLRILGCDVQLLLDA